MRKRRELEDEGLNLIPIMNLVTILIPFLLLSVQFVTLSIIDTTLPAISDVPAEDDKDPDEDKLSLSVLITTDGFTINGADKVLDKDDEENGPKVPCLEPGCPTSDSYDYATLTKRLAQIKDRYEDEENVILVPHPKVAYETLILTMDGCRDDQEDKDDESKARLLFPAVVIAGGVE